MGRGATSTFLTQLLSSVHQCCFTSTETAGIIRDGRLAQDNHLDFHSLTQLMSHSAADAFRYSVALCPQLALIYPFWLTLGVKQQLTYVRQKP